MIKVFPFYKGKNISNNPLGYTTVQNARKRMNSKNVIKDFDKTLPEDYWFDYLYSYENDDVNTIDFNVGYNEYVVVKDYDIRKKVYLKDIKNDEVISIYRKLKYYYDNILNNYSNKEIEHIKDLAKRISNLGYYPYCWKDDKDYKKKFSKFVTDNVEFREMDVNIELK